MSDPATPPAPSEPLPRVSVVVPVRNRRDLLAELLASLDAQTFRDLEVVVVDDGSTDGADSLAAEFVVAGRSVVVARSHGAGAVAARRVGVEVARGEVLAFTDSDCRPSPRWIEAGVAAIDAGADLVNGLTQPARPLRPLERSLGSGLEGLYPTCNLFIRRSAYDETGGFDQGAADRLGFRPTSRARGLGFGEDTLLGWRLAREGRVRYEPDAFVAHHVFPPDVRDTFSRVAQVGAFPALIREVPELRRTLVHHRILFGPRRRVPAYLTAVALLSRRRALVGGAAAWWVAVRWRDLRATGASAADSVRVLPVELALDVVWCASLVAGSVRARTLVL